MTVYDQRTWSREHQLFIPQYVKSSYFNFRLEPNPGPQKPRPAFYASSTIPENVFRL